MTDTKIAPNSVQIQQNYTSLCIATGKPASEVVAGDSLVMRTSAPGNASQAWVFGSSPGPISWAGNTSLQIGWDAFGKVQLVAAPGGIIFTYNNPPGIFV